MDVSWTIKAEHRRTDAFELGCWRRLSRVPWTARRSNQSKEISPEYSLKRLMLKLKLQYFGHLLWRTDSLEKTLMLGKWRQEKGMTEDEMVGWHHRLTGHEFEQAPGVGVRQGSLAVLQSMGSHRVRHDWVTEMSWTKGHAFFQMKGLEVPLSQKPHKITFSPMFLLYYSYFVYVLRISRKQA